MKKKNYLNPAAFLSKSRYLKKTVSMLLIAGMLCTFTACGTKESEKKSSDPATKTTQETDQKTEGSGTETTKPEGTSAGAKVDFMKDIKGSDMSTLEDMKPGNRAYTEFALKLFKECNKDNENKDNMLISPLSVIYALGMTSSGSAGSTAEQFEKLYGLKQEELNKYMYSYLKSLPNNEDARMAIANSIWINNLRSDRKPLDSFLHCAADYYSAQIYGIDFNDIHFINDWVKEKTEGMIEKILEYPMPDALMCLVNAVAFDAKWEDPYEESQIHDAEFKLEDGSVKKTKMMYSEESVYLEDENAKGFMKYYKGGKYAFAALLPKEGTKLDDYIAGLDGEKLFKMLQDPDRESVQCAIPEFEVSFKAELQGFLAEMGIEEAFDPGKADFTNMYEGGGVFIDKVIHKTYMKLDEKGTKAAAVTAIIERDNAVMMSKYVILDRPFVYMLVDCENGIPFFVGRCDSVQ